MSFKLSHRDECERAGNWQLVRRTLDLRAFGLNIVELGSGEQIPAHDELARDQEEVFYVLDGSPTLVIDGEDHPARAGTFARLDPSHRRTVRNDGAGRERADRVSAAVERLRADGLGMSTSTDTLNDTIAAYNDAWNAHDLDRIASMHAPDMVFENHTAGERAEGEQALAHIAGIFESWPDISFQTRRLYVREDLVVQEWTAAATHVKPLSRGEIVAAPSGRRIEWKGMDVIPFEWGKVKRKDVYSDSVSILRQVGLL